jgi:Right handed beta helix region
METLILDSSNNACLDDLINKYPSIDIFYLKPGTYNLTKPLEINKDGVRIIGYSNSSRDVHIKQTTNDKNAINIFSNNTTIKYISFHIPYESTGICLAQTNSSWSDIEDCTFYGGDNYCVYISNNNKDTEKKKIIYSVSNLFNNNILYAKNSGKAVFFGFQECCSVKNNIIRGGVLTLHLVNKCLISNNVISDSSESGLSLFLPTYDTHVVGNNIKNSKKSGISIKVIVDFDEYELSVEHNLIIEKNIISDSDYYGLEINNGNKLSIQKNCINKTGENAIYLLKTENTNIISNTLCIYKRGIMIDLDSNNNNIDDNSLYAIYPEESEFGIGTHVECLNNKIKNNLVSGIYISNQFIKNQNESNLFENNNTKEYISYIDELKLAKL